MHRKINTSVFVRRVGRKLHMYKHAASRHDRGLCAPDMHCKAKPKLVGSLIYTVEK